MSEREPFVLEGEGVLRARVPELDVSQAESFQAALRELVRSGAQGEAVIDLTDCQYMSSIFIGLLIAAAMQLKDAGREMRLLVSPRLHHFLDTGNLGVFLHYTVAEDDPAGENL